MVLFIFLFISVYLTREPNLAGRVGAHVLLPKILCYVCLPDCRNSVSSIYLLGNIPNPQSLFNLKFQSHYTSLATFMYFISVCPLTAQQYLVAGNYCKYCNNLFNLTCRDLQVSLIKLDSPFSKDIHSKMGHWASYLLFLSMQASLIQK